MPDYVAGNFVKIGSLKCGFLPPLPGKPSGNRIIPWAYFKLLWNNFSSTKDTKSTKKEKISCFLCLSWKKIKTFRSVHSLVPFQH